MTDWAWKYLEWGSAAVLTIGSTSLSLTAVDFTSGSEVLNGVQTVSPQAEIRASELADLAVDAADLDGATLTLNGTSWRIAAVQPLPTTAGEADGEYLLFLEAQ